MLVREFLLTIGMAASLVACKPAPLAKAAEEPDFSTERADDIIGEYGMRYPRAAYEDGRKRARDDLQKGDLAMETFGLPSQSSPEYQAILESRYKIKEIFVAGCAVDAETYSHAKGYNEIMEAEIKKRFGQDIFERIAEEAVRLHKDKGGE